MVGGTGDGGRSGRSSFGGDTGGFDVADGRFKGGGRGRGLKEFRLIVFDSIVGGPVEDLLLMGGLESVRDEGGGRLKSAAVFGAS